MALRALFGADPVTRNVQVASVANYARAAPVHAGEGQVRMLTLALDYKYTSCSLTCSMDAKNMEELAQVCQIGDVTSLYDEQCTKPMVRAAIKDIAQRCAPEDYLIIYYSGHGTSTPDYDGDESDGKDEAFCFVDEQGQISEETCMNDDEFADIVTSCTHESVRILILTDCCHSGTIADLNKDCWANREVISIAGCLDNQTSGDMGKGGIFTHSMLLGVDQLSKAGEADYSVGMLYNACIQNDDQVFSSAQDITIQSSASIAPDRMAWPLVPLSEYHAPLTKAVAASNGGVIPEDGINAGMLSPDLLQQFGISPQLVHFIDATGLCQGKVDPTQLLKAGFDCWMSGGCQKDACTMM